MQESMNTTTVSQSSQWSNAWNRVASHRLWSFLLIAIGSASSVIYPHPPLVAFGAIAGTTLTPKRALSAAAAIWLVNQIYGYALRQYPQTSEALLWGLVMGLGTVLVTAMAAIRPTLSKMTRKGHWVWVAISVVTGFLLFESLVLSLGLLLTGEHVLTWAIFGRLLVKDLIWAFALTLIHVSLTRLIIQSTGVIS
ncbi:MAG: hypothetical protein ACKO24_03350 [Leptolyngbyaceae cyanobacterium]